VTGERALAEVVPRRASDRLTARLGTNVAVAGGLLVTGAGMVLLSRVDAGTGYGLYTAAMEWARLDGRVDLLERALDIVEAGARLGEARDSRPS
jgi:hypothetical protein